MSTDLGKIVWTNGGEYDPDTQYEIYTVVTYNGSSYVSLTDVQGIAPTNTAYWQLVAQKGEQGAQGPQGPQGEKGADGTSFRILGEYDSAEDLELDVPSPEIGDAYKIGTEEPFDIYTWTGTEWLNLGPLQGPAGPPGEPGSNEVSTSTDTNITGLLKGASGKVAQAVAGTDYATPTNVSDAISDHDSDGSAHSEKFNAKESLLKNLTSKANIVDNDSFAMVDSQASDASKRTLWSTIKSTLKTYFDTLYNKYTHPTFTAKSSGLWKITVNSEGHVTDASAVQKSDIVNLGIPGQDTIYVHPTGDGNLHVPATGTTNNGKVLKAGATAGSIAWGTLTAADVGAATTSDISSAINTHDGNSGAHSAQFGAKLDKSGGTMTGMLTLNGDPSQPMHAATKQYVDSKTSIFNVTLDTSWSGSAAPYSNSVTVTGILATDTPIIDVVMSGTYSTDEARIEAWGYIYRAVTANGYITFYATEKPSVELPIQIKVVR
jgi:hypothetical protein